MLLLAITLVVCAPGYPGTSAEAQPAMDALARALGGAAHLPVEAVYEETAEGGLKRLGAKDAALLLAPLPFFLDQERKLALAARMMAVPKDGTGPLQKGTLVTGKEHPADLRGYPVQSTAGYSPRFVHAMSPPLKGGKVVDSAAILSGLRRAANGERLALLLDGAEAHALSTLPFAQGLAEVATSEPVPVALVATVGKRLHERQWEALQAALLPPGGDSSVPE